MSSANRVVEPSGPETEPQVVTRVETCGTWEELIQHQRDWECLLDMMPDPSIFVTPEWMGAWWKAFGAGNELVSLVFRDHHQQVVAIAPLYRERSGGSRRLRLLGAGSGDSDALDFIIKPGTEHAVAAAFVNWLKKNHDWTLCSLETLARNSSIGSRLPQLLHENRWSMLSEESINYVVDLPSTWQAYLQILDPKFRPLLTRYPKRLQTRYQDARISRCEDPSELSAALEKLFALHQMRWTGRGEAGAFSSAERRHFYARMAEAFLRRGWLEFWRLEIEGQTAATQFCFRYRDTISLLQEGFDPKYAADKVGYALRARVLETVIQSGARHYDFLGGSDSYKPKFGARAGSYLTLHFAGPSLLGRIHLARKRSSKQVRRWLRNNLPQRVLAALDRRGDQKASA